MPDYNDLLLVSVKLIDAQTHEITIAGEMIFSKGSVVVIVRLPGSWPVENSGPGRACLLVTLAKLNITYEIREQYDPESQVIEGKDIFLTTYISKQQYGVLLRYIRYLDSKTTLDF